MLKPIATFLVALLMTIGAGVGALVEAQPAAAQTVTGAHITFCTNVNGTGSPYVGPVNLVRNGSLYRTGRTGNNGCATFFNVARNSTYSVQVSHRTASRCPFTQFSGATPHYWIDARQTTWGFGTIAVTWWRPC